MIKNVLTGKFYIGSTIHTDRRFREHLSDLRKGKHHSIHLQRAFDKYGEKSFIFEIIESVDQATDEKLREREQYYIDTLMPYRRDIGYNVSRGTATCVLYGENNGFYGREHSEETRFKIAESLKKYNVKYGPVCVGRQLSDETKKKISLGNKGKKRSEEVRKNISEKNKGRLPWNKGKSLSDETKMKLSEINRGENNTNAKIDRRCALNIKLALYGDMDVQEIVNLFSVSVDTVYNIKNGKVWSFVRPDLNDYIKNREKMNLKRLLVKAEKMYLEGCPTTTIAKELCISRNTIRKHFKEKNIEIVKRNQYS